VFTIKSPFLDHHIDPSDHVGSPHSGCVLSQAALAKAQRGDVYDENREAIVVIVGLGEGPHENDGFFMDFSWIFPWMFHGFSIFPWFSHGFAELICRHFPIGPSWSIQISMWG
jgi:hypothetical protein